LKSVSRLLAFDFEVAGLATDGRQALEISQQVTPDIIVLDITMPGRDGFQTAQDLKRIGSRAPIVFLTMHEGEEFVAHGFRSGGRGYVLKTRLQEDLITALERVLAGQLFLPSLKSLLAIDDDQPRHAVQFHSDEHAYVEGVGGFVNAALRRGGVVSVVSTPSIRTGLAERLKKYGWRVGESGQHGRYRASDARQACAAVMRDGHPDSGRIEGLIAELESWGAANAEGPESRVTLVGDIAGQLVMNGDSHGALELDHLWNELTRTRAFLTVCCYPSDVDLFPQLCAEHDAVAYTPEDPARFPLA
jgi:CheY-like chemotaxis protein